MKVLILFLICLCCFSAIVKKSWKDGDLEKLVLKDKSELERVYGAINQLKRLKSESIISKGVYKKELDLQIDAVSKFIGFNITTEEEINDVIDFFISPNNTYSLATKASGVFTFTNVLLIVSIITVLIAFSSVMKVFIFPWIGLLRYEARVALAYISALIVLVCAKLSSDPNIQNYIAFLGALSLGGAYMFHLSFMHSERAPYDKILLPVFLVWSFLAIAFETKLIGFIAVAAFEGMFGFFIWSGPLIKVIGFVNDDGISSAAVTSGVMLTFYIINVIYAIPFLKVFMKYLDYFEAGILFLGTMVYYISLLILSCKYYSKHKALYFCNFLAICSGFISFYIGTLTPQLAIFRGVSSTFFVLFLMEKYGEIEWGKFWSLGLLGAGLFLVGVCYFIKSFPELFIFG